MKKKPTRTPTAGARFKKKISAPAPRASAKKKTVRSSAAPRPRWTPARAPAAAAALAGVSLLLWLSFKGRAAFLTVPAGEGDTSATLAQRYLDSPSSAWMIEDYNGAGRFAAGQNVGIPLRPWNVSGVYPDGYQVVPILVYHNLAARANGRLVLAAASFAEQMRYLKRSGFRVVSLPDFVAWTRQKRQLPRKAVVLTFDDGYRSFRTYAYPVLKELGFTATLFVPTDSPGLGPATLGWDELKSLAAEGFDIEPHSKTHTYLTRNPKESDEAYARRLEAEIAEPRRVFAARLGRAPRLFAYPYGNADDAVLAKMREQGYAAAFTVWRQSSPSFVNPLLIPRRQVYSEMTLADFVKNLEVFRAEKPAARAADEPQGKLLAALAIDPSDGGAFARLREMLRGTFRATPRVSLRKG